METFLVSLLNGLVQGLLLFMVAAGLTLVFGMMGIINFAHASFYMLGAYLAYSIGVRVGFFWAIAIAPILVGLVGIGVECKRRRKNPSVKRPIRSVAPE